MPVLGVESRGSAVTSSTSICRTSWCDSLWPSLACPLLWLAGFRWREEAGVGLGEVLVGGVVDGASAGGEQPVYQLLQSILAATVSKDLFVYRRYCYLYIHSSSKIKLTKLSLTLQLLSFSFSQLTSLLAKKKTYVCSRYYINFFFQAYGVEKNISPTFPTLLSHSHLSSPCNNNICFTPTGKITWTWKMDVQ